MPGLPVRTARRTNNLQGHIRVCVLILDFDEIKTFNGKYTRNS